jgi:hypothetical protein
MAPRMPQHSSGKSGSVMIYSEDKQLILKTISHSEAKSLFELLPGYFRHIMDNPKTTLSKFMGLHRLERDGVEIYFTVLTNVFDPQINLNEVYDLKGSTAGRRVLYPGILIPKRAACVLKDLDFCRKLPLNVATRAQLVSQISRDCSVSFYLFSLF